MIARLSTLLFLTILATCAEGQNSEPIKIVRIIGVSDGDTLTVVDRSDVERLKITLAGIDAPELDQAYGQQAKRVLMGKIIGETVELRVTGLESEGNMLGHIYFDNRWINQEMVAEGWAWHTKSASIDRELAQAEVDAIANNIGLWRDPKPVAPWTFRTRRMPSVSLSRNDDKEVIKIPVEPKVGISKASDDNKVIVAAVMPHSTSSEALTTVASHGPYYIGASHGWIDWDSGVTAVTGTARYHEADTGFKVFAGVDLNKTFSVEAHYLNTEEESFTGNAGDTVVIDGVPYLISANGTEVKADGKSYGVSVIARIPVDGPIKPFARLGVHFWESYGTYSSTAGGASFNSDGTDVLYGLGLDFIGSDRVSMRAEFERFELDGDSAKVLSLGFILRSK